MDNRVSALKIAARFSENFAAGQTPDKSGFAVSGVAKVGLPGALFELKITVKRMKSWISKWSQVLSVAKRDNEGLPADFVWQGDVIDYLGQMLSFNDELDAISDKLDDVYVKDDGEDSETAGSIRATIRDIPRKARFDHAISEIEFFDDPRTGKELIAYPVSTLQEWGKEASKWIASLERLV